MKKLIAILLSLTFILSVSVYATNNKVINDSTGSASFPVIANYVAADETTVYSIDISWGDMAFNYKVKSKGRWDPDKLNYTDGTDVAGWYPVTSGEDGKLASNEIKIVNKSNTNIDLTPTFTTIDDEDFENITAEFSRDGITNNMFNIPEASVNSATEVLITLELSNAPSSTDFKNSQIGTVTLQIN